MRSTLRSILKVRRVLASLPLAAILVGCAGSSSKPSDTFFENMTALCGQTVSGNVISEQEVDADWRASDLVVGPVTCEPDTIRLPLAVGEDTSRTWVLSRMDGDLIFRHEHVEPDGSPSAVTQYGGAAREGGTASRQDFPADAATKANFQENGLTASLPNVWTLSLDNDQLLYALARPATNTDPARDFRAAFQLNVKPK